MAPGRTVAAVAADPASARLPGPRPALRPNCGQTRAS